MVRGRQVIGILLHRLHRVRIGCIRRAIGIGLRQLIVDGRARVEQIVAEHSDLPVAEVESAASDANDVDDRV